MNSIFRFLTAFFVSLSLLCMAHADVINDARMSLYDVTHYDLTIAFDIPHKTFRGNVRIQALAVMPMDEFVLSASNETLTIDSVKYNDANVPFHHETGRLIVKLAAAVQPSARVLFNVFYHGISKFKGEYENGGVYFTQSDTLGRIATSSEPNFARTWWPCKDVPSDKATASITITVPRQLTAVSNGILKDIEHHGETATYHWETRYPIATYLISVAAAEYKEFSDTYTASNGKQMPIYYYVFPKDVDNAKKDFEHTSKILKYLSTTFCEYPFIDEKFGYAEVQGSLTMENQTICSIEEGLITGDKKYELTIIHETSHHWWGDFITPMDWHHTWLNEGFATYTEALYLEHEKGKEAYNKYLRSLMSIPNGKLSGSVFSRSDTAFWDSFSGRVYYKGAIVLHMLRTMLGDSVFFRVIRNYINNPDHRYGNATTEDFIRECERGSGQNLKWFFNQWVYAYTDSTDRPEIAYNWTATPSDSQYTVTLNLKQSTASILLYKLPFSVSVTTQRLSKTFSIIDSLETQSFTFIVPEKPTSLEIDKENNIFKLLRLEE